MSLRLCILGSGSSGNATVIWSESTALLIDAGLSAREVGRRLELAGKPLSDVRAVCVSHEHSDHTTGLRVLHQRHGLELYGNAGTVDALRQNEELRDLPWKIFSTGQPFVVGDLTVHPFSVPHDAYEPVGFTVTCGEVRAAVVTDIGLPTTLVRQRLRDCQVIVLESNHDERLLQESPRPWSLKQRISGRQGHLSNTRAAALLAEIATPALQQVYLAHLSDECNRADLALAEARRQLARAGYAHVRVHVGHPDRVSEPWAWQPAAAAVAL
jgi:phosphoribosyl 1,2-cyclic phosphodiesterase